MLHPQPLLKLFELGFTRPNEAYTVDDEELEIRLFMPCLVLDTPCTQRQYAAERAATRNRRNY